MDESTVKGSQQTLHSWRGERDSNPWAVSDSPVFKTGSLNLSDISPYLMAGWVRLELTRRNNPTTQGLAIPYLTS